MHRRDEMNTSADKIHAEAGDWFARLRASDCRVEDRAAFERWREADPRHADTYALLEEVWDLSSELAQDDPAIAAAVLAARHEDHRPWWARRGWPIAAAALVALACFGLYHVLAPPQAPAQLQHYATAAGEQRTVTLEDGTQVVLDTATSLDVRYERDRRNLVLQQGQAAFTVRKAPARPFVVTLGQADVTATGTQFQVRLDGGAGRVTLLEGQVIVASRQSKGEATLLPGQRIDVNASGTLGAAQRLNPADRANAEGWTAGQLVVADWPLEALVTEVNRYGRTRLRLGDDVVGRLPVSGTFDPTQPEAVAMVLQVGWPVQMQHADGEIVLSRKK